MNIFIVGLGLIGGSIAIDLKKRGFAKHISGFDINSDHSDTALRMSLVDEVLPINEGILKSDLIIIATPVDTINCIVPEILDNVTNQVVVDMGSTKKNVVDVVKNHKNRKQFVASHPMAGTEYTGPAAAFPGLFDGKVAIICDKECSGSYALNIVIEMYNTLYANIIYMNSAEHDNRIAYVSHLSHIISFSLALTAYEIEQKEKYVFNLAGGGFDSTVRLAGSSAKMWNPILIQNRDNILDALDSYIDNLILFKENISSCKSVQLEGLITKANKIHKIINS